MKAVKQSAPALPGPMQAAFEKSNIIVVKDTQMEIPPQERGISVKEDQELFARQQMLREMVYAPAPVKNPDMGLGLLNPRRRIYDFMVGKPALDANQIGTLINAEKEGYTTNVIYAEVKSMQDDGFFDVYGVEGTRQTLELKHGASVPEAEYTHYPKPARVVVLKQPLIPKPKMGVKERCALGREVKAMKMLRGELLPSGRKPPEVKAAEERARIAKRKKREADRKAKLEAKIKLKEEKAMAKNAGKTAKKAAKQPAVAKRKYVRKAAQPQPVAKRPYVRRTPLASAPQPPLTGAAATTTKAPNPQALEQLKNQLRNTKSSEILEALKQSLSFADLTELKESINGLLK